MKAGATRNESSRRAPYRHGYSTIAANGSPAPYTSLSLKYNAENLLVKVSQSNSYVARFVTDGDGQRRKRLDNYGTVIYVGPHYERNVGTGADTSDVTTKMYWAHPGPFRRLIAVRRTPVGGTESLSFVHHDHLGSTKKFSTDGTGFKYYPYGSTFQEPANPPTDNLYTGQKRGLSTGLYFYGARYYNPANGMFAQPDTIVPNPANPQSLNRFSYVLNNPLAYTDPTGHDPVPDETRDELWYHARGYQRNDAGDWMWTGEYTAAPHSAGEAVGAAGNARYVLLMVGGIGTRGYEDDFSGLAAQTAALVGRDSFVAFHLAYNRGGYDDDNFLAGSVKWSNIIREGKAMLGNIAMELTWEGKTVWVAGHSRGGEIVNDVLAETGFKYISKAAVLARPFYVGEIPGELAFTPEADFVSQGGSFNLFEFRRRVRGSIPDTIESQTMGHGSLFNSVIFDKIARYYAGGPGW